MTKFASTGRRSRRRMGLTLASLGFGLLLGLSAMGGGFLAGIVWTIQRTACVEKSAAPIDTREALR
jgi:hypothetical protein